MSEFNIDELKNKINSVNSILEEIRNHYKSITDNSSLQEIDQQLIEINKAITNLQKNNTQVPDALRELKNQMTTNLMVKTDADEVMHPFLQNLSSFVNDFSISKTRKRKSSSRLDDDESLEIVIEVVIAILRDKMKISRAFSLVAKKHSITSTGVRNKCAGQLGINLKVFKNHISNNHQALINQIVKTYPDKESYIKSKLGQL